MSWFGLLLIGFAVTDLTYSVRRGLWLPPLIGSAAVVGAALVAGLTDAADLAVVAALVGACFGWSLLVTRGFGRGAAWHPLAWLAGWLVLVAGLSPWAGRADGLLGRWLRDADTSWLGDPSAGQALLLVGAMLLQLSTGNVIVRLVLRTTGSMNPHRATPPADARLLEAPPHTLKGGRLLGPMERVFILGLGLAGQYTAASIVVAAKGLLRYPELSAAKDDRRGPGLHAVTEYFLVGSFVSWLVALGALVMVR